MRSRRAFTITEVAVTLTIVLVIASVGAVGFNQVRDKVTESSTEAQIRQVAHSLQSYYQTRGYFPTDIGTLSQIEPAVTFIDGPVSVAGPMSLAVGASGGVDVFALATLDSSGQCVIAQAGPPGSDDDIAVSSSSSTAACDAQTVVGYS